jgi:hypothetical protein
MAAIDAVPDGREPLIHRRGRDDDPAVALLDRQPERSGVGGAGLEQDQLAARGFVQHFLQVAIGGHPDRAARRRQLADGHRLPGTLRRLRSRLRIDDATRRQVELGRRLGLYRHRQQQPAGCRGGGLHQ